MTKRAIEVVPVNDLKPHIDGRGCWCSPKVEQVRNEAGRKCGVVVTHNSADGRELIERNGVN